MRPLTYSSSLATLPLWRLERGILRVAVAVGSKTRWDAGIGTWEIQRKCEIRWARLGLGEEMGEEGGEGEWGDFKSKAGGGGGGLRYGGGLCPGDFRRVKDVL